MRDTIHFGTIQKYFKTNYDVDIDLRSFKNNLTGDEYSVIIEKGTDIALYTVKNDGSDICLDSNGDAVDEKYIFAKINGENVNAEGLGMLISVEELELRYDNDVIDVNELIKLDEKMFPDRTCIVLNNMLSSDGELTSFYVDEVIYVDGEEFDSIRCGNDSEILKEYNQKTYPYISDGRNGVLVISNVTGDGLLIDTQGYDYARYMSYAPLIKVPIESILENQMREDAVYEMKLYVPLMVTEYDYNDQEEVEICGEEHWREIKEKVAESMQEDGERGLAKYFWKDDSCRHKVYSIKPDVELRNEKLMGVAVIKMTKPLEEEELESLKDYITGQFSDGWGEGFEQHEINVGNGEIYVHFWDSCNYYIHTEEEMEAMEDMEQNQGMQGMQM